MLFVVFSTFIGLRAEYDSRIGNALVFSTGSGCNGAFSVVGSDAASLTCPLYKEAMSEDNPVGAPGPSGATSVVVGRALFRAKHLVEMFAFVYHLVGLAVVAQIHPGQG